MEKICVTNIWLCNENCLKKNIFLKVATWLLAEENFAEQHVVTFYKKKGVFEFLLQTH